jgi:hypothetical protein
MHAAGRGRGSGSANSSNERSIGLAPSYLHGGCRCAPRGYDVSYWGDADAEARQSIIAIHDLPVGGFERTDGSVGYFQDSLQTLSRQEMR